MVPFGIVTVCFLTLLYFWQQMQSGYASPDFTRSLVQSTALYDDTSAMSVLWGLVGHEIHSGSLGPLALFPLLIWIHPWSEAVVHCLDVLILILNFCTFYALVFHLTRSNVDALFAVLVTFCSIEFTLAGDPYLTNLLVLPFAAQLLLTALLVYVRTGRRRTAFVVSCVLLAAAIAVVPACAIFVFAFIAYAWQRDTSKHAILASLVFLALGIGVLLSVDRQSLAIYAIGLDRLVAHIVSAFPVTYRASTGIVRDVLSTNARDRSFDQVPQMDIAGWIVAFSCAITTFVFLSRSRGRHAVPTCSSVGAVLWVGGAFFPQYGSFFVAFGFAMVCTGLLPLIGKLRPALTSVLPVIIALALFFVIYGNVRANKLVAASVNGPWVTFASLKRASNYGLFGGIRSGSPIAISPTSSLAVLGSSRRLQRLMLFSITGKRFSISKTSGGWLLRTSYKPTSARHIDLDRLVWNHGRFQTSEAQAYREFVSSDSSRDFLDHFFASTRGMSAKFINYSNDHALVYVRRTCGPVQLDDALKPASPTYTWATGFYPYMDPIPVWYSESAPIVYKDAPRANPPWRYARRKARVVFSADSCGAAVVNVAMTLYSALPGFVDLSGAIPHERVQVGPEGTPISFALRPVVLKSAIVSFEAHTPLYFSDEAIPRTDGAPLDDIHLLVHIDGVDIISTSRADR